MEVFEIYTLGAGYYLEKVFNALRIILNGDFASIMKMASIGAILVLAVRSGINNDFKSAVKWFLGVTVLVALFLNTKATVKIFDTLPDSYGQTSAPRTVQDVPWGLAFIGSITSKVGNSIAEKFDSSLSGVFNNSEYQKTGILFGSKIVEDISKIRATDPQLKQFMLQFYKKCIVPDLNMGLRRVNGYTVKDLTSSDNILEFLSDHSSKARLIHMPGGMERQTKEEKTSGIQSTYALATVNSYISCNEAAKYIKNSMEYETSRRIPILANSFLRYFQPDKQLSNSSEIFKSVLSGSYGIFIKNVSKDAKDILLQNMAINSLGDTIDSRTYGKVATEAVTKSAYYSVSQMAQKFVPILRAVLECLFYGVFPLVLILMVTPIGLEVLKNYAFGFVYLQLWQPMYAILFCIAAAWGEQYASNINGITFGSHTQISRINEEISSVAGFMLTLVPVLSLFITKGMVASMGNLASSIAYIPQSAAVQNAESAVKGNYQLGTTSIDSHSSNISSSNKHDDNYTWMSGMKSFGMSSGAQERMLADGRAALDSSGAVSNLSGLAKIDMNRAIGSRYDQSINDNISQAERHASTMVESAASGYSKMLGFDQNFSKGSNAYENWQSNLSVDQRSALDEARSQVSKFAESQGISQQDALKLAVAANANVGAGKKEGLFANISASLGFNGTTGATKDESFNKMIESAKDNRFSESMSTLENLSNASYHQEGNNISQNMLEGAKSDFAKSKSAAMEVSKSMDKVHSLQTSKGVFEQNSGNISQELSNMYAEERIKEMGSSAFENILRTDPDKNNQMLNQFLDKQVNTGFTRLTQEVSKQKDEMDHSSGLIREQHSSNLEAVNNSQTLNKEQVISNMPENFSEDIKETIQESKLNNLSIEKRMSDKNYIIENESDHSSKQYENAKLKIEEQNSHSATGHLARSKNPFKKKE